MPVQSWTQKDAARGHHSQQTHRWTFTPKLAHLCTQKNKLLFSCSHSFSLSTPFFNSHESPTHTHIPAGLDSHTHKQTLSVSHSQSSSVSSTRAWYEARDRGNERCQPEVSFRRTDHMRGNTLTIFCAHGKLISIHNTVFAGLCSFLEEV